MLRVYCAGPLFNPSERAEMVSIASTLELSGFSTFLSHRDVVVANLNGRVPDEGTIVEATLAWHSGKPLVLYKTDVRSMLGGSDNPMVTGLGDFESINDSSALPAAVERAVAIHSSEKLSETMECGASIAMLRDKNDSVCAVAAVLYQNKLSKK